MINLLSGVANCTANNEEPPQIRLDRLYNNTRNEEILGGYNQETKQILVLVASVSQEELSFCVVLCFSVRHRNATVILKIQNRL